MGLAAGEPGFLRLEGLCKSYGSVVVIDDFSLSVRRGEFVSLLGPSGCGKTTTLRMISGFADLDSGAIVLDGQHIERLPSHRRDAAMVFQNYALFPHMTVYNNIAFGLRMRNVPTQDEQRRVGEVLELVRLSHLSHRYPRELSGGQQQRVALARAVVLHPRLLLLDEPLSNLDAKLRYELRDQIREVHRIAGITTVFVTHDLEEAFALSDRVAVMNQGRLEQFDTPAELFVRPRTAFVAAFVGHTNVMSGTLEEAGGRMLLRVGGREVHVETRGAVGRPVRMALPIPAVTVSSAAVSADNCFAARVTRVGYLGATARLDLDFGGLAMQAQTRSVAELTKWKAGDEVFVGWNARDMVELPAEPGEGGHAG